MMPAPVSVIITCYNLQHYIAQAIKSVQEQDYAGEVQIIVVDDNSIDRSKEILQSIGGIEVVLRPQNGGVMRAMISGLREARHDVVFFLDGDDIWHKEKLTRCMARMTARTKLCTHDLWYMDGDGRQIERRTKVEEVLCQMVPSESSELIKKGLLEHGNYVWLGSAFGVSRTLGDIDAFISFCERRDYLDTCYQDWPLAVWVALAPAGEMTFVEKKLFGYRLHNENYSGASQTLDKLRRNLRKSRDTMRLIEEIIVAKGGDRKIAIRYRQIRVAYELLLATTLAKRSYIAVCFLKSILQIRADLSGVKVVLRVVLALLLGSRLAHSVIESLKR